MIRSSLTAALLLGACALASAEDVLLSGHVQRVILQPSGTENCPPLCPAMVTRHPDGTTTVCISNTGGRETMEVKVDQVYAGRADTVQQFRNRIGEFGPRFTATSQPVIVSQEGNVVNLALVTERDGKQFIDPKRLWKFGGLAASSPDDGPLVDLDVVLARLGVRR
jgi:hypothetical protein